MDRLTLIFEDLADEVARRVLPLIVAAMPTPVIDPPMMLDAEAVGRELGGVSETTVRQLWRTKVIPIVKVGGLRRTRRVDLIAYIEGLPVGEGLPAGAQSEFAEAA